MDPNYILGNKKTKSNVKVPAMISGNVLKDRYPVFPSDKPVKKMGKNYPQSKYLKSNKGNSMSMFTDSDGDRVVNGMDCFAFDKKRHGLISSAIGYLKAGFGAGRNEKIIEQQKMEQAQIQEASKDQIDAEQQLKAEYDRQNEERELKIKQNEEYVKRYNKLNDQEAMYERNAEKLKKESEDENVDKESQAKYESHINNELKKARSEKDRIKKFVDEYNVYKKKDIEADQVYKIKKEKFDKIRKETEERLDKLKPKSKVEYAGQYAQEKVEGFKRGVSRSFGYAFESPENRYEYKLKDVKDKLARDIPRLETKEHDLIAPRYKELEKSGDIDTLMAFSNYTSKLRDVGKRDRKVEEKEQEMKRMDAIRKTVASRENIKTFPYEARQKRALSEYNEALSRRNIETLRNMPRGNGLISMPKETKMSSEIGNISSYTIKNQLIPQQSYTPLRQPESNYDPNAPKYKYEKDTFSITRKSSRRAEGEPYKALSGTESNPLIQFKQGSSSYPWTKPMKGYKRVLAGYGRSTGRGRRKGTKTKSTAPIQAPKQKFTPYASTYALKGKKPRKSSSFM